MEESPGHCFWFNWILLWEEVLYAVPVGKGESELLMRFGLKSQFIF